MSDWKRFAVWIGIVAWCFFSLAFDVRAANTIIVKKKAVESVAAGEGTSNNISLLTGHYGGLTDESYPVDFVISSSSPTVVGWESVTSGNVVIVAVSQASTGVAYDASMLTKAAGTATIGTVVADSVASVASRPSMGIFRVPITGTGTLTLRFDPLNGSYFAVGAAEFTGFHASPVSLITGNTNGTNASTGESTGNLSISDIGILVYMSGELPNDNLTRTGITGTTLYNATTGSSTMTGLFQYTLINSADSYSLTCVWPESVAWAVVYQVYKTN